MNVLKRFFFRKRRLLVIGLDGVPPEIAFQDEKMHIPNLRKLFAESSTWRLETINPPITVPAWACMTTGKTPGELGIYGFRNRVPGDYTLKVVTSRDVKVPAVWDELSTEGKEVIVVGVPPAYPPKPVNGIMLGCFLTPDSNSAYAYPAEVKREIEKNIGPYLTDVHNFRTHDKERLFQQILDLTEYRFKLYRHLFRKKKWDFFMFVEMGPDRMHHGFWKFYDKNHIRYEEGHPLNSSMYEYYRLLDEKIGELLSDLDSRTSVVVVSDHGAQRMDGGICINEWLAENGFLKFKKTKEGVQRLSEVEVDWSRTLAWGEGGYYGRIFLNIKGREKEGALNPEDAEKVKREIQEGLEKLGDEKGRPIGTKVYRPEEIYPETKGVPPDLIVIFGDLHWRSIGTVGWNSFWTRENDTGPDDANHSWFGILSVFTGREKEDRGVFSILEVKDLLKSLL